MDDKLKDLMKSSGINNVTDSVQQPPSGVEVKATTDKTVEANVLNQGEAKEQALVQGVKELEEVDPEYHFVIEQGKHKVTIELDNTGVYNYHATCSCAWEGRFMTHDLAELTAKKHLNSQKKG